MKVFGRVLQGLALVAMAYAAVLLVPLGAAWVVATVQAGWASGLASANAFAEYQRANPAGVGFIALGIAMGLGLIGFFLTRETSQNRRSEREFASHKALEI
jgi:hypothetical protein